ncbi:19779_t:CDS:1, partial [Cetraspora pellucida]
SAFAKFSSYIGQEPPDDYLNKVIQSYVYLEGHMTVLENANARDFDNMVKCNILKSMMSEKYVSVPANNNLVVENPAINSPDTL